MRRLSWIAVMTLLAGGCYESRHNGPGPDDGAVDPAADDGQHETVPDVPPDTRPDVPPDVVPDILPDGGPFCTSDGECAGVEFCEFEEGACGGYGTCMPRGMGPCPEIYSPVCGCDNVTYDNDCFRQSAGVSVLHDGPCGTTGCYPGDPYRVCRDYEYCEGPAGVCDLEGPTGWCAPRPEGCDDVWDPVCGCDGNTYSNDCGRQMAGVWLDHRGDCGSICQPGDPYGQCDEGEFCEGAEGQCDIMGVAGWCQVPDTSCGWLYDPVCGCDGRTYANDCERQAADVWRDYRGECADTRPCGGTYPPCGPGSFCEFPPRDCGFMDGSTGTCLPMPSVCPEYYDPVCGCDGRTYGNDCMRQAAGVSLCYDGPCGPEGCPMM
jgi:hypothetical protein